MTRICFLGDVHGNFQHLQYVVKQCLKHEVDYIVQVGDFGYFPHLLFGRGFVRALNEHLDKRHPPIYFVDGNHEDHDSLHHGADAPVEVAANVFYLPRGYTWTWGNTSFLALGGAYSVDCHLRVMGRDWFPREELNYGDCLRATQAGKVDVMVTHDAPICVPLDTIFAGSNQRGKNIPDAEANRNALQSVFEMAQPQLLVHGHYHSRYETQVQGCRVIGLDCDRSGERSFVIREFE